MRQGSEDKFDILNQTNNKVRNMLELKEQRRNLCDGIKTNN